VIIPNEGNRSRSDDTKQRCLRRKGIVTMLGGTFGDVLGVPLVRFGGELALSWQPIELVTTQPGKCRLECT